MCITSSALTKPPKPALDYTNHVRTLSLCKLSWEDGERCLLTPNRVPVTDQSMISPNSSLGESIRFLGLFTEHGYGSMYRNVWTPIQGSPNDAAQSRKDGAPPPRF